MLIQNGSEDVVMDGMVVGQVLMFLGVPHGDEEYPCAVVEWMHPVGERPDPVMGMWIVVPEKIGLKHTVGVVYLDCIARSCHLIGVYGETRLPYDFTFSDLHTAFKSFYLNKYIDYHSHEEGPGTVG